MLLHLFCTHSDLFFFSPPVYFPTILCAFIVCITIFIPTFDVWEGLFPQFAPWSWSVRTIICLTLNLYKKFFSCPPSHFSSLRSHPHRCIVFSLCYYEYSPHVETVSTWYSQVQIQFSMSYVWESTLRFCDCIHPLCLCTCTETSSITFSLMLWNVTYPRGSWATFSHIYVELK